jgi:hypothetical protein
VDDFLDVSRFTRGLIEVRKEVVPLSRCVVQALESVRDLVADNHRALDVSVPEETAHVMADPARMEQVLGNLLSNAIQYTDDGGRALPLVFERFVRGGQSLRASRSGLGIGLTLVKKLVELHGGSVTARSEGPGKGSESVVTLPVHVHVNVQGPVASVEEPAPSVVAPTPLHTSSWTKSRPGSAKPTECGSAPSRGTSPADGEKTRGLFDRYFIQPVDHRSLAEALSALAVLTEVGR